jgi:hypothetical protein
MWDRLSVPGFLVALSSVVVRETFKYGERGFRYCNHDVGHAMAAMAYAATLAGWEVHVLSGEQGVTSGSLSELLRFPETAWHPLEDEEVDTLLWVTTTALPFHDASRPRRVPVSQLRIAKSPWGAETPLLGKPRRLALTSHRYPEVETVRKTTASSSRLLRVEEAQDGGLQDLSASGNNIIMAESANRQKMRWFNEVSRQLLTAGVTKVETAAAIILQRRSVQSMEGDQHIDRLAFEHILSSLFPTTSPRLAPHLREGGHAQQVGGGGGVGIHLAVFVHRVKGLAPGLYLLVRNEKDLPALRAALDGTIAEYPTLEQQPGGGRTPLWHEPKPFLWTKVPLLVQDVVVTSSASFNVDGDAWREEQESNSTWGLYALRFGDYSQAAERISCDQQIAGGGTFSLGMLGRWGDWDHSRRYKELLWESGAVGQGLYLLAEAHGLQGTGIGCFYDDAVHRLLGLTGRRWEEQELHEFDTCDGFSPAASLDTCSSPHRPQRKKDDGPAFQSIYHFTVGRGAHSDKRIMTYPAYEHLEQHRSSQQTPWLEDGEEAERAEMDAPVVMMQRPMYPIGGGIYKY